eukprot:m.78362 g.78362  ORF g.78362 m.78362 type:complete len:363 (-) comp8159_c0_seq3:3003-4091(-)
MTAVVFSSASASSLAAVRRVVGSAWRAVDVIATNSSSFPSAAAARSLSTACPDRRFYKIKSTVSQVEVPDHFAPSGKGSINLAHTAPVAPLEETTPFFAIGGTAQNLESFDLHAKHFARSGRSVYHYETRGQGKTKLSLDQVTLTTCADDLAHLLDSLGITAPIDLCGFSFGGRVALAFAADYPERVRRVVLTGVAACRGTYGQAVVNSWLSALQAGDLPSMARSMIGASYSSAFVEASGDRINKWIDEVVKHNTVEGLLAIVSNQYEDTAHKYSNVAMAQRLLDAKKTGHNVLLLNGDEDKLAEYKYVSALANVGHWNSTIVRKAGHAILNEQPLLWRRHVCNFVNTGQLISDEVDDLVAV